MAQIQHMKAILTITAVTTIFLLQGCSSELEQRRKNSLESLQHTAGTSEQERRRQQIVKALENADSQSLSNPSLVNVTMHVVKDESQQGILRVDWISAQPDADGIRIIFSDETQIDVSFDDVEKEYNNKMAKQGVVYVATPFVEREHPNTWTKLLSDREASFVLIRSKEAVSNARSMNRRIIH